jgi:hypothetical protein
MILTKRHCCRECGKPLDMGRKATMEFCSTAHRIAWRNRRMSRGAELYDLFMAMRYDREQAKIFGLWKLMCRLGRMWNEEDKAANRQSYFPPKRSVEQFVHVNSDVLVHGKHERNPNG